MQEIRILENKDNDMDTKMSQIRKSDWKLADISNLLTLSISAKYRPPI